SHSVHTLSSAYSTTLPLHDALPIYGRQALSGAAAGVKKRYASWCVQRIGSDSTVASIVAASTRSAALSCRTASVRYTIAHSCRRSEEHTSELQSGENLVCRHLLE